MSKKSKSQGYSYSWTQPYNSYSINYTSSKDLADGLIKKYNLNTLDDINAWIDQELDKLSLEEELDTLDKIDEEVSLMDRYPDAEAMIERLKDQYLGG